jgi:hypothetical protein
MLLEAFFNLPRVDIITTADDHVFFPVDHIKRAFLIHMGNISGVMPPIAQSLARLLRPIPIPHLKTWSPKILIF